MPSVSMSYDNETTHKKITEETVKWSSLDSLLKGNLGIIKGYKEKVNGKTIIEWLSYGSYLEDVPDCRASNHFHDPLKPWSQSYMTDEPWYIKLACFDWKKYSNVTWATGSLTPPPDGQKASFSKVPAYEPINWDKARQNYYNALISSANNKGAYAYSRPYYLVETFKALGQVMHLLEDMAVPAHTRNDFRAHLIDKSDAEINSLNPLKWKKQPYEYYVQNHPELVTNPNATPIFPSFSNTKLTDFWDTDKYNGSNPSNLSDIGLAEFSNANYFSDFTIYPNNAPTPEHIFPYPYIKESGIYGGYQICTDLPPAPEYGTDLYRKYISRKIKGSCSQITPERKVDHFAAVSLLDEDKTNLMSISSLRLWLDENVHKTYANELLPAAIGYSAKLLDYFFRGDIRLSYETIGTPGYVITNYTGEKLEGRFTVYYDNTADMRNSRWMGDGVDGACF
jgi:hypothetical protein